MNFNKQFRLIELINTIFKFRHWIIKITILFSFIGILISFTSPIKYTSSTIFIPQSDESVSPSFSGVASLVGINLGGSSRNEIPASMYPQISNSPEFKRLLLEKTIDLDKKITVKNFIIDYYNLNENEIKNSSSILYISKLEDKLFKIISEIITIYVNQKDGFITISATMPIAEYASTMANFSKEILQEIIIRNKIERAQQNLVYIQNQLNDKRVEFNQLQSKLSYFKDSNLNLVNSKAISEQDEIEAEFQIINAVVTELSKQVEQAKLKVKKDTPVFSTIKKAFIPNIRSSPKRKQIVLGFFLFGIFFSTLLVTLKDPVNYLIKEIKNNN